MAPLGPFEPRPRIGIAVSGGADSMALALLAARWADERGGVTRAIIVDHRLRPESAAEADQTRERLARFGIAAEIVSLGDLPRGPGLAARARAARYAALGACCRRNGLLHLLLGQHAADQAETLLMRALSGSGDAGLAGMSPLRELPGFRVLRPLLRTPPARLRDTLRSFGCEWVEDPSNADPRGTRARLRLLRLDRRGEGPATVALAEAARARGLARHAREQEAIAALAGCLTLRPEGFALVRSERLPPGALGAVLAAIGGAAFAPATAALQRLEAAIRPATLGGVRILAAGKLGPGWLIVREAGAMAPSVPARPGAVWDGRFRLTEDADPPGDWRLGGLGPEAAAGFRRASPLPAAVLATLPAFRRGGKLVAVPHLDWPAPSAAGRAWVLFAPVRPAGPAPFAV